MFKNLHLALLLLYTECDIRSWFGMHAAFVLLGGERLLSSLDMHIELVFINDSWLFFQDDATMRDTILAIRADEAHHRIVNHTLASLKPTDYNPYEPGK